MQYMPLLLHFLSKQMILAVLIGNTSASKSWKSGCNIDLKYLCEELSVRKLQSTLLCLCLLQPSISVRVQRGLLFTKRKTM